MYKLSGNCYMYVFLVVFLINSDTSNRTQNQEQNYKASLWDVEKAQHFRTRHSVVKKTI